MKRFGNLIAACCMLMQIANSEMELNTTCQNETSYKKGKISIAFCFNSMTARNVNQEIKERPP